MRERERNEYKKHPCLVGYSPYKSTNDDKVEEGGDDIKSACLVNIPHPKKVL